MTSSVPPPAYQAQSATIGSDDLVRALLDRVSQLEARLQEQYDIVSSDIPLPPPRLADNPASPANDEAITLSTDNDIPSVLRLDSKMGISFRLFFSAETRFLL